MIGTSLGLIALLGSGVVTWSVSCLVAAALGYLSHVVDRRTLARRRDFTAR
jgi:hypothetical protein